MKIKTKKKIEINKETFIENKNRIIRDVIFLGLGFLLSTNSVLDSVSPFGVALVSVCSGESLVFSAVGSALSYIIFGESVFIFRYVAAVIMAGVGALAITAFDLKKEPFYPMTLSFLSIFATGFVLALKEGASFSTFMLYLGESILAGGASFFFYKAIKCRKFGLRSLSATEFACLLISCSILLMSVSFFDIYGISIGRTIAVFVILTAVYFGSPSWGMIVANSVGFAIGIGSDSSLFIIGAYGFSALVGGVFKHFGKGATVFSFVLSMVFFSIASSLDSASVCPAIESVIASLAFFALPNSVMDKFENFWGDNEVVSSDVSLRQSLVVKLRFASSAMAAVSESVETVSEKIKNIHTSEVDIRNAYYSPEELRQRKIIDEKANQIRMVASDQFFSIADMLFDLSAEFDNAETFDSFLSSKIRDMLLANEIEPKNVSVITDKFGRTRVEIHTQYKIAGLLNPKIKAEVTKICNRKFEKGRVMNGPNESMLSFLETPEYSVEVGFAQHSATGGLCGDTIKILNDSKGKEILVLSDGMGTGGRAALDGAMASGLLSKLIAAGFGFDSSLKVVNSALLVKSNEESLATLDIASIDLFSGRCEFYKAGAAASYVVKNSKVTKVELSSMPAGILRGVEFAKRTVVLSSGDLIVVVSDGVIDEDSDWLAMSLQYEEDYGVQILADRIIKTALKRKEDNRTDDMSVIVAKIKAKSSIN